MKNKELKQVILFFIITIISSYFIFWGLIAVFKIPTVNLVNGGRGPIWAIMLFIIGGFVPSITGIVLTACFEGNKGVKEMLKKSIQVGIGTKWFIIILLIAIYFAVSLIGIYTTLGGRFDYSQFLVQLSTIIPLIILGPLSEEYGWRGFATKRLLNHVSPNFTSLLTGLVWAIWHLPLFFMAGSSQHEFNMPFLPFLISVTSISFVYTYVFKRTNQNLFSVILLHWVYTYVIQVVSNSVERSSLYNWLEFVPTLLIGLVFAFMMRKKGAALKQQRKRVQYREV